MNVLKKVAVVLGWLRAVPFLVRYRLLVLLVGEQRAMTSVSECVAKVPGLLGVYCRQVYYRDILDATGRDVYFGFMSLFSKAGARVGDRVYIGRFCTLGEVTLEDDVMLADGVQVLSGRHQHGRPDEAGDAGASTMRDREQEYSRVTVARGAWIGANAIVMADVGPGAVVGAGAVVVKPVAAGAKVGGVPAKVLG